MMISKILLWQGKLSIFKCFPQYMSLISKARYTSNKGLFAREQLCQPRGLHSASSPSRLRTETINDIDELFQNLNNSEHAVAESVKYAQLAPKLRHMIYSDLNCISWVNIHGDNYSSAYLQMLSLDMVDGLMEPLLSHPFFPTLLSQMQSCRFEMSDTEVLTTLSCLIQLGVKGEVVGQFWEEMCERCPSVSVHDLALVSQVLLNQSMFGFGVLTKLMMDRFLFAVDHGLYDGASDDNTAHDFAKVFLHLGFLFDEPTLYKLLSKLSDLMSNNCNMKTMDHVTSYLKCTWPVSLVSERCDTLISEIIDKAGRTLLRNIDILEYHHVSDISQTLKKKGIFTGDLVDQIHERSTNLLQSADKLTVVVHLLAAIKRRLEPGLHRSVNDFLTRNISDVDLMTLQSLARIGTFQKPYSSQVDRLIQEELIKKMTQFIKFNFGTYSALIFILQSDKLDHQQFLNLCTSFNSHLSNCQLHSQLSIVFGILMKHIPDDEIPNYLQKKILELLPKWNLRNIGLFLIGFENRVKLISQSRSTLLKKQVLNIQNCLFESVSKNIEMEGHILPNTMFLYLILSCALNSNRDYAGISSIIDCFLSHPYKHSLHAVVALIDLFNEKRFFNSRLYDKFAELFVQFPVVKLKYIGSLIKCFGEAGHKPNNYKEFIPYLADIFNRYDVLGISHYSHKLQFVLNVCKMQHFPEHMLKEIFSLPSLEIAEKEMMLFPDRHSDLALMQLNRIAVLNCPHLNIPWFHEDFCNQNLLHDDLFNMNNEEHTKHKSEMADLLVEVLGGRQFLNRWVYTPYYYRIDFEFLLDDIGMPVKVSSATPDDIRVAVLVHSAKSYCYKSSRLLGFHQLKIIHLDLMGYKIVEIPYNEWEAVKDLKYLEKYQYVESKVKEQIPLSS